MEDEELKELEGKPLLHVLKRLRQTNQSFAIKSDLSNLWTSGVEIWLSNGGKLLKFHPKSQKMVQYDDSAKDEIGQTAVNKHDYICTVFEHPFRILERHFIINEVQPEVDIIEGIRRLKIFKREKNEDLTHNCSREDVKNILEDPDSETKYDGDSLMSYFDLGLAFVLTSDGRIKYFRLFSGLPGHNTFGLFQHCNFTLTLKMVGKPKKMLKPYTLWNSDLCDKLDPKPKRVWPKVEKPTSMACNNAVHYFKLPGMVLSVSTRSNTVASVTLFRENDEKMKDFWLSTPPSGTYM